jgi:hypothetical protein
MPKNVGRGSFMSARIPIPEIARARFSGFSVFRAPWPAPGVERGRAFPLKGRPQVAFPEGLLTKF